MEDNLIDKTNFNYYKINYTAHDGTLSFEVRKNSSIVLQLLREYNIFTRGKKILDFGFGTGNVLALFHRLGSICYGVDILPEAVSRLAEHKEYELRLITENRLPFKDNMFDIVVASESIEHVPNESLILTEIVRVLKPNGFFIMGVPADWHSYNPLHFREYTKHDINRLKLILGAYCLGYRAYGGRLFFKIYGYLNKIASNSMGIRAKETLEYRIKRIKKELPLILNIARYIYHKVFVKLLIIFYLIDGKFHKDKNKEIWFVFKLSSF